ncbi:folate-binding protein [uncultured Paracoccus sp.]|uniref:CAF17-like 4Fe-4S cluster assembly/insertion protein YgfZ n=1 Tax=uncultured Paracoccus sp. TaxID=189685 RepID=UPI00260A7B1A|nr:folate-binding protein [uncultured Paracoccus sp.]
MRTILRVGGDDRVDFLQGLVTNDVTKAPVWAALLTPQGKYLADFFVVPGDDALLVDVDQRLADDLLRRLTMYRLRAKVTLDTAAVTVSRGTGPAPAGAIADPRHADMGWRLYRTDAGADAPPPDDGTDWDAIRVAHTIPETLVELIPNESFILESGFEDLHGVDFRKGCYVGQEVTARMKHKTELRKGLRTVRIEGEAPVGTAILTEDGREAGTLFTQSGGQAIAHLRFDRARGPLRAGDARITVPG